MFICQLCHLIGVYTHTHRESYDNMLMRDRTSISREDVVRSFFVIVAS